MLYLSLFKSWWKRIFPQSRFFVFVRCSADAGATLQRPTLLIHLRETLIIKQMWRIRKCSKMEVAPRFRLLYTVYTAYTAYTASTAHTVYI